MKVDRLILIVVGVTAIMAVIVMLLLKQSVTEEAQRVVVGSWGSDVPTEGEQLEIWIQESLLRHIGEFTNVTIRHWKEKRDSCNRALVAKATAGGYDATSLSNTLQNLQDCHAYPYIPIAAYTSTYQREPVWIISLRWGGGDVVLGHVATQIFTTKDLKQVGDYTCK